MWKNVYDVYIENNIEKRNSRLGKIFINNSAMEGYIIWEK